MHYNYTRYQQRKENNKKQNKMKSSLGRKSFHVARLTLKIVLKNSDFSLKKKRIFLFFFYEMQFCQVLFYCVKWGK